MTLHLESCAIESKQFSQNVRKRTFLHRRPTKTQITLRIRAVWSVFVVRMKKRCIPWLSIMRPVKILIRLRECAGWSESSLGAPIWRYISWRCGSNHYAQYANVFCCFFFLFLCMTLTVCGRRRRLTFALTFSLQSRPHLCSKRCEVNLYVYFTHLFSFWCLWTTVLPKAYVITVFIYW